MCYSARNVRSGRWCRTAFRSGRVRGQGPAGRSWAFTRVITRVNAHDKQPGSGASPEAPGCCGDVRFGVRSTVYRIRRGRRAGNSRYFGTLTRRLDWRITTDPVTTKPVDSELHQPDRHDAPSVDRTMPTIRLTTQAGATQSISGSLAACGCRCASVRFRSSWG